MCGFCHAPEHAYDVLAEDDSLSRDALCWEALERLAMATTPYPDEINGVRTTSTHYAWDEDHHQWEAIREWGSCTSCGNLTWRRAGSETAHLCAACATRERATFVQLAFHLGRRVASQDEIDAFESLLPDRRALPIYGRLRFSDYEVHDTRDFEHLPGPRTYEPRPVPSTQGFIVTRPHRGRRLKRRRAEELL